MEWSKGDGARLSLDAFDSFTLTVNGKPVPIDQLSAEAEVGRVLVEGKNAIAVRVATTLNNRLVKMDESVAKRGLVQPYGLIGPVVLEPSRLVTVSRQATGLSSRRKNLEPRSEHHEGKRGWIWPEFCVTNRAGEWAGSPAMDDLVEIEDCNPGPESGPGAHIFVFGK